MVTASNVTLGFKQATISNVEKYHILTWISKKQELEPNLEQWTGSKLGREYCLPAFLTYMQSTYEMLGWMTHKLESRLAGETSTTSFYLYQKLS